MQDWGRSVATNNFFLIGQKMNAIDALPEQLKKSRGRPKAVKVAIPKPMTMARYADSPPPTLPKTELQRVKELKELLINSAGSNVVHKAVEIAMNDDHPAQMAAIKLCMDRMLPVSLFEKEGKQRSAVNITISGCLLYTSPSPRDYAASRMPSSA